MNIQVLYEDKDVVVIDKPAGLLVHGIFNKNGPKHTEETLVDWLSKKYPETSEVGDPSEDGLIKQQRGGIVHRLDRDTSGVMVIARNQKAFTHLKKLFSAGGASASGQARGIKKTYLALVWGRIHELRGVIDKPISIKDGSVKRTVFKGKMPREAITEYATKKHLHDRNNEFTLVEVYPKTGRTHQIRVHFSAIGHAVVGDKLYGKQSNIFDLKRHFLHAAKLEFTTPSGKRIAVAAPLPQELTDILTSLQSD